MPWNQALPATNWDGNCATWMTQLPDELSVQDLSIPGTHDSAALLGFTHANVSVTQNMKIEDQLAAGIRFLDLRVKIQFQHKGLAMYHGADAIYDPYSPNSLDQLYYQVVVQKCVDFLKAHPQEGIIISLKSEGDEKYDGRTIEDWFREIANNLASDNPPGTWEDWWRYPSNVNATLKDIRGKMLLWRRFSRGGKDPSLQYDQPFGLDLTPMNGKYDDTQGASWYTPEGGYSYVQDNYKWNPDGTNNVVTMAEKFYAWEQTFVSAHASRSKPQDPNVNPNANRQYLNFLSLGAGKNPSDYSDVLNPACEKWLKAVATNQDSDGNDLGGKSVRSGCGVVPMDYPTPENVAHLIRANFGPTYRIYDNNPGIAFVEKILTEIRAKS